MKKRKDGRYCKKLTINGKQKAFYGETQSEVYYKIRMFEEKQEQGRTFSEVADEWEEDHEKKVTYGTMSAYYPCIRRAKEYFGDSPIKDITPTMVNRFVMEFCKLNPSRKTAYHQLTVVSMILKSAIIAGDIDTNPAQYVELPMNLEKKQRELPSEEDIKIIEKSVNLPFGLFPYFLMYTGVRKGEALALNYEDIDFKENTIKINKAISYIRNTPYIKPPKTVNGNREVPLPDKLKEKLDETGKGLVFPGNNGPMTKTQFQGRWNKYVKESELQCTAHQIRHAYATIVFEAGISSKDAQHLLGHADITTTNNIYTHIKESRKKETALKLNAFLNK